MPWYNQKSDGEGPADGFNAAGWYNPLLQRLGAVDDVGAFKGAVHSYLVFEDADIYYAMHGDTGAITYGGPDDEGSVDGDDLAAVIQAVLDTGPCTDILLKLIGEHEVSAGLTMAEGAQRLRGLHAGAPVAASSTRLKLAAGINADLVNIAEDYTWIQSLVLDGNKANQVGNWNGVKMANTTCHCYLDYVFATQCGGYGFSLYGANCEVYNSTATYCGSGWYLKTVGELSYFREMKAAYNTAIGIWLDTATGAVLVNPLAYQNTQHGIYHNLSNYTTIYAPRIELNGYHGILIAGSHDLEVYGGVIRNNSQGAANTYDDVCFSDSGETPSTYNLIHGVNCYADGATVGRYGINELDKDQDYNLVIGGRSYGHTTGEVHLLGLHSAARDIRGYNPVGIVANPFDTTNTRIEPSGDAAAPTASTTYTVAITDIVLSSTDSGNTNCAIMVKDPAGNDVLQAAVSTLTYYHVPRNYQVTWGAFTGAAPTVTVAFL